MITQGVDLLVLGTSIITNNIKLMERHFGLEEFVRASASRVRNVERWQNVFELRDGGIYLRNFTDVEQFIDLFTERYTKSKVTGQEYDTEVKEKALPIM